jgi:hypothetical protein
MEPEACFQYFVQLDPEEYFRQGNYQSEDNVFWLSIVAIHPDVRHVAHPWGWKSRPASWMDAAVRFSMYGVPNSGFGGLQGGMEPDPLSVTPIKGPVNDESFDMAFELDTDIEWVKWEQPFTGLRDWVHYEDELSYGLEDDFGFVGILRVVADDWRCEGRSPVSAITWWGSHIGYGYEACTGGVDGLLRPDYFLLQMWDDVPAGADPCYAFSHPGNVVWEYKANDYDEVLVGYDKAPEGEPNEPVFRYSMRLPQEAWFSQTEIDTVYWLSIAAIYKDMPIEIPGPALWGWTNHEHAFNDDAVAGHMDDSRAWVWDELFDQTGASEDMSFMLFTDYDPILGTCWDNVNECGAQDKGDVNCDGWINFIDLGLLKVALFSTKGQPNYNCCADFNHDEAVNFVDLGIMKSFCFFCGGYTPATGNQDCPP